jgi:hypothetical protein
MKIQEVLRHGKGLKGMKRPRWKKFKLEAEGAKTRLPGLGYRSIWFSQNR